MQHVVFRPTVTKSRFPVIALSLYKDASVYAIYTHTYHDVLHGRYSYTNKQRPKAMIRHYGFPSLHPPASSSGVALYP